MDGLKDEFAGQVDFFDLDIDRPETEEFLRQYEFTGRSQYLLMDAEGNVLRRWFGPLSAESMGPQIEALLRDLDS